ncbi:MarR family winged helix-turn-helix transcriptional regulator [Pedococcus sp.]|jgi:DNA-binding MarR family transcriptional regulator|uniref:MarR family winged helix-turn-helix transcriptional regulator n=1 Tax=Pedococcus sp. TaxID=2860345 RepID=UPI002E13B5CF|nr:MarR family transcriptional regulator [Pedococcus sp.]
MSERQTVGNDLLRAAARLTRWASRHASFDLPYAQARLLALLDELGPARVSVLAEADHSSQPAMTTALQRLEAQGLAQRRADPDDARASLLALTDHGRATLDRVRAARLAALAPTLDGLEDAEIARLRTGIDVMEDLLRRAAAVYPTPTTRKEP